MPKNIESQQLKFSIVPASFGDSAKALVVEANLDSQYFSIHLGFHDEGGKTVEWFQDADDNPQVISGVLSTKLHVKLTREILTESTITLNVVPLRPSSPDY